MSSASSASSPGRLTAPGPTPPAQRPWKRKETRNEDHPVRPGDRPGVDGRTWDLLDTYRTNALAYPTTYRWLFEQTTFPKEGDTTAHTKFRRIKQSGPTVPAPKVNRLGNATVSVASGARLRAEGDVTISKLEVDANGAGTIDGFAFAESGKLVVDNLPDRTAVALPGSYPNAKGFGNLSKWTLESADGKSLNSKIVVQDGEIMIVPNGLLIIVR